MHGIQNFRNSFSILIPCRLQQAIRLFKGCYDILPVFTHNRVTEFSANLCIGNKYSRPLLIKCKVSQMYQKCQHIIFAFKSRSHEGSDNYTALFHVINFFQALFRQILNLTARRPGQCNQILLSQLHYLINNS